MTAPREKLKSRQRLQLATSELATLRDELAFDQIRIRVCDGGRHWRMYYGANHIAEYWPASGKGRVTGQDDVVRCVSAAQAQKLAVNAKQQVFSAVARELREPSEDSPTSRVPHEAP